MSVVKIDSSNANNFKNKQILPAGEYVMEVANDLVITKSQSSDNNLVKVELRVADEGEFMGCTVYDNIVLSKKAEWKVCHLALACGTQTKEEIQNDGVDLALIKGSRCEVKIGVEPPSMGTDGTRYSEKNKVERYIFEEEK